MCGLKEIRILGNYKMKNIQLYSLEVEHLITGNFAKHIKDIYLPIFEI